MKNAGLRQFVDELVALNPGYAGMGGATAGIVGAAGSHSEITQDLRQQVLAFAAECAKVRPDAGALADLSGQLEGSLRALRLISAISDERLQGLLAMLDALHAAASARAAP